VTYRLILSLPIGSSVEALSPQQHAAIGTVRGRWTAGGMPGSVEAVGRYLIDVLTDAPVTRQMLDALGLPQWMIVGCWRWDVVVSAAVETIEPLDAVLYRLHLPAPTDPDTGLPSGEPAITEIHRWAGWPPCIPEESST